MIAAFTSVWHLFMRELGGTLGVNSARCNHSAEERDPGIAGVAPHNRPYPDSLSLSLSLSTDRQWNAHYNRFGGQFLGLSAGYKR